MVDKAMWFSPPIAVRDAGNVGRTINVSNVPLAGELLLAWGESGPKWRVAVQTCIDTETGKKTAADVRKAFEAAAKEAGMLRGG